MSTKSTNALRPAHAPTTGVLLVLVLAIFAQFALSPIALATARQEQEPPKAFLEVILPDGTEFNVVTTDEISSKTAAEGDQLNFKVAEDVVINGHIVIAKDALVKGVVSSTKKAGMLGRGGNLAIRIESTTAVDKQKTKLRSSKGNEGDDKTGTTVALVVLFGPLGFLKHGKNAKVKAGTVIKVYTDEEKKVQVGSSDLVVMKSVP
jgi:hypothetical protein